VHENFPPAPSEGEQTLPEQPLDALDLSNLFDLSDASQESPNDDLAAPQPDNSPNPLPARDTSDELDAPDTMMAGLQSGESLESVPWTFRQTLIGMSLTLGPWLLFAIVSQVAQLRATQPTHPQKLSPSVDLATAVVIFIISSALEAVFLIAPLVYASRAAPSELQGAARLRAALPALGLGTLELIPTVWATVIAIAVIFGSSLAYDGARQALHLPLKTNADQLLEQAKYEPYTVIATLLVAVLVAPICEEIFFRGFVFPGLARGMPLWGAIVASAVLFGVAHADLGSLVVLYIIGVVLAVVRWRTHSLWPGVVVHTLNNTIAFVGILVLLRH
jgi:membrane protease YdiL (CAAX protease family)